MIQVSYVQRVFKGQEREILRVDQEIDRRVYVLYGLTEEEIKIVEGSKQGV